jgi:hypothetical protein
MEPRGRQAWPSSIFLPEQILRQLVRFGPNLLPVLGIGLTFRVAAAP